jgi:multisubunit Na+/H+ antiporter MnhB subunit
VIDWAGLAFNALWVVGTSIILAALSFFHYEAQRQGERLRVYLQAPRFQTWLFLGLLLICLGLALLGPRWWERVVWGLLCGLSAWQLWTVWHESRGERQENDA